MIINVNCTTPFHYHLKCRRTLQAIYVIQALIENSSRLLRMVLDKIYTQVITVAQCPGSFWSMINHECRKGTQKCPICLPRSHRSHPWWLNQMKTFSALLAIFAGNSPVTGEFTPHKGKWRRILMFSLMCAWRNGWVSNGKADDLRRHRAHYDVIVMFTNTRKRYMSHLFSLAETLSWIRSIS